MNFPQTSEEDLSEEGRAESKKRNRKSAMEWSVESSIALIQQVEQFENIWDSNSKFYKNRDMNSNSWNSIAETLKIQKHEVMLRWNALRGNYQIHVKKNSETKSGQAANKYKRLNPLFAEMKFLDRVMKSDSRLRESNVTQTPSPIDADASNSLQVIIDSESNDSLPSTSTPKRQRISQSQTQQTPLERTAMRKMMTNAYDLLMQNVQNKNNDEWDALGNMIAANARTWSLEDLSFARRYKAALSAVNAQFEMEAAESTSPVQPTTENE